MAVSMPLTYERAKATPVSRERLPMPVGGGRAWPDNEPTSAHQAPPVWRAPEGSTAVPVGGGGAWPGFEPTYKHTPAHKVPLVWRAPEGPAAVPVGGGGAWPGFETTRRAKLAARTTRGRAAAHGHIKQPSPQDSTCGARNTSGPTSTTERRSLRTPRSTPGSDRPGGRRGGRAR